MEQTKQIKRVGVIGGGQLAWMMAPAADALGVELAIQTPRPSDPAAPRAAKLILASIDDAEATREIASVCDVITFENEFVNLQALSVLQQQGVCFRPRLSVLAPLLDKYQQRCYLREIGLPVPEFIAFDGNAQTQTLFPDRESWRMVMKARRHGYDGQGTVILKDPDALAEIWERWGRPSVLLEEFVPFERELAVMAARNEAGEVAIYPIVETQQEDQVCRRVLVPADLEPEVVAEIEAIARTLLDRLQVVGIFGIELFLTRDRQVLVNEIAPRTHNSGHYTLDACETSQFEMHLRAVCDLPLGSTALLGAGAVMVNLLGYEYSQNDYQEKQQQLAEIPGAHVYWYGKNESRPGRKLGHVTVVVNDKSSKTLREECLAIAERIESIWYPGTI